MKNIFIVVLFIVCTTHSFAQKINCDKFKTGIFYYPQLPDYGFTIRDKKVQKSYIKAKDMWVSWDVKWIDACNFELTYKSATKNDGTFGAGDRILVTITKVEADCYSFLSVFYNTVNPKGLKMPEGKMCFKK